MPKNWLFWKPTLKTSKNLQFLKKKLLYGAVFSRCSLRGCLEAARKKPNAVPQQNRSPLNIMFLNLNISCGFCFFDRFNAPEISS